jgi:hypothetical protein
VVSLTITRWPLYVITHASGDLDLHHQQGRHLQRIVEAALAFYLDAQGAP